MSNKGTLQDNKRKKSMTQSIKKNKRKKVIDEKIKTEPIINYKVFVFDLDNTLYLHHTTRAYSDDYHKKVKKFLVNLKTQNKILSIATHNKNPKWILKQIGIFDLFDHIVYEQKNVHPWTNTIEEYTGKNEMVQEIINKTKCKKEQVIFFDDFDYNIKKVEGLGVKSVKVSDQIGIVFQDVLKDNKCNLL